MISTFFVRFASVWGPPKSILRSLCFCLYSQHAETMQWRDPVTQGSVNHTQSSTTRQGLKIYLPFWIPLNMNSLPFLSRSRKNLLGIRTQGGPVERLLYVLCISHKWKLVSARQETRMNKWYDIHCMSGILTLRPKWVSWNWINCPIVCPRTFVVTVSSTSCSFSNSFRIGPSLAKDGD